MASGLAAASPTGQGDSAASPPAASLTRAISPPGDDTLVLDVPNDSTVNFLIGKGGNSINELQAQTGTRVVIQKQHETPQGATHRRVAIVGGSAEQREACGAMIRARVTEHRARVSGGAAHGSGMVQGHVPPPWLQPHGQSSACGGCTGYQMHGAYGISPFPGYYAGGASPADPYAWPWQASYSHLDPHLTSEGLLAPDEPPLGWPAAQPLPVAGASAHPLTAANPLAGMVRLARHAGIEHGYEVTPPPRLPSIYAPRSATVVAARARRPA
jgi:hypothetical protein